MLMINLILMNLILYGELDLDLLEFQIIMIIYNNVKISYYYFNVTLIIVSYDSSVMFLELAVLRITNKWSGQGWKKT